MGEIHSGAKTGAWPPLRRGGEAIKNLKGNWLFPLCGTVFFATQITNQHGMIRCYIACVFIEAVILTFIATQYPGIWRRARVESRLGRALLALNTFGLCLPVYERARMLSARVLTAQLPCVCAACACCAASFVFFYPCVALFWRKLIDILKNSFVPDRNGGGISFFCPFCWLRWRSWCWCSSARMRFTASIRMT